MLFFCLVNYEEQTPQAICASNNLFGITPESVGSKLKKGTYCIIFWIFNNLDFYMCKNGYMALVVID